MSALLLTALRQYRHNHEDGFVFGYDKAETDRIVMRLVEALEEARLTLEVMQGRGSSLGLTLAIIDRAFAAYREQGDKP